MDILLYTELISDHVEPEVSSQSVGQCYALSCCNYLSGNDFFLLQQIQQIQIQLLLLDRTYFWPADAALEAAYFAYLQRIIGSCQEMTCILWWRSDDWLFLWANFPYDHFQFKLSSNIKSLLQKHIQTTRIFGLAFIKSFLQTNVAIDAWSTNVVDQVNPFSN